MAIAKGEVFAWGTNGADQLGRDHVGGLRTVATRVSNLAGVVEVDGGRNFGLAVLAGGTVDAWGSNQAGDLGNGPGPSRSTPEPIPGLVGVTQVSGGNNHSLALLSDGTVMAWGDNLYGDLGIGSTNPQTHPVRIPGASQVVAVSAGCDWSMALRSDGTVLAWGLGSLGQLGQGSPLNSDVPIAVKGLPRIVEISAGGNYASDGHALALDSTGNVWAWGDNHRGQLGTGVAAAFSAVPARVDGLHVITSVSAGGSASSAVDAAGVLWVWGSQQNGQLGTGASGDLRVPTRSTLSHVASAWSGALGTLVLLR